MVQLTFFFIFVNYFTIVAGDSAGGAGRLLVLALDLSLGADGPAPALARPAESHGPGRQRRPALVLDAGRGGKKRRTAKHHGAPLLRLAALGG